MGIEMTNIKLSIFGRFDKIDAGAQNVSKMFEALKEDGFLPAFIQLVQIQQPGNVVKQLQRPQLVDHTRKCTITFYPDRIDFEFPKNIDIKIIIPYVNKIIILFDLKATRVALNASGSWNNLSAENINALKEKFVSNEVFSLNNDLIEWNCRNVARINLPSFREKINVGQHVNKVMQIAIADNKESYLDVIFVIFDINSLGEYITERLESTDCTIFFNESYSLMERLIKELEESLC